jgi:hypothetical protein
MFTVTKRAPQPAHTPNLENIRFRGPRSVVVTPNSESQVTSLSNEATGIMDARGLLLAAAVTPNNDTNSRFQRSNIQSGIEQEGRSSSGNKHEINRRRTMASTRRTVFTIGFSSMAFRWLIYRGDLLGPITLVEGHYLEIQTYNSHGNCFYMYLNPDLSCCSWSCLPKPIFSSIRTTKKHDLCHFLFARLFC